MPPSKFGARPSTATAWNSRGSPFVWAPRSSSDGQDGAGVVRRAPDDEVVGVVAPVLLEPGDVRLEAAGRRDDRLRPDLAALAVQVDDGVVERAVLDREILGVGVVEDVDAEALRGLVVAVHHAATAAEHEEVGPGEVERAPEWALPLDAVLGHPLVEVFGRADRQPGEILVGLAAGDPDQVVPELVLGVEAGHVVVDAGVHVAHVAGVAAVAATEVLGGAFEDEHLGALATGGQGGAHRRVAAADDEYVH